MTENKLVPAPLVGTYQLPTFPSASVPSEAQYADVLAWARPQDLPVTVVPGADHFFHRRLHILRAIVQNCWR